MGLLALVSRMWTDLEAEADGGWAALALETAATYRYCAVPSRRLVLEVSSHPSIHHSYGRTAHQPPASAAPSPATRRTRRHTNPAGKATHARHRMRQPTTGGTAAQRHSGGLRVCVCVCVWALCLWVPRTCPISPELDLAKTRAQDLSC